MTTLDGETVYIALGRAFGYGGPLTIATMIRKNGTLEQAVEIDHTETLTFWARLESDSFMEQFQGRKANEPFDIGRDIDAVSGATVSSSAVTKAIRKGAHSVATEFLNMEIPSVSLAEKLQFGFKEKALCLLYGLVIIGILRKYHWMRYITLLFGLVFLGFYSNSAISLSNFGSILLGYFPPLLERPFWWLLVGGVIFFHLVSGRNVYCYWMCPFGAVQEITAKIVGFKLRLPPIVVRSFSYVRSLLLWAGLLIIFITGVSSIASFEPFATIFGQQGGNLQWFMAPLVILGSFILSRFWCRIFCPVGTILTKVARLGAIIRNRIRNIGSRESNGSKYGVKSYACVKPDHIRNNCSHAVCDNSPAIRGIR
jgi:hypothetical protein